MRTKKPQLGILLIAILLMSMVFVPAVSAAPEGSMEKWMKDHTIENVKLTTMYKYEEGYLEIKETYSGDELRKKTGIKKLKKERKIPLKTGTVMMNNGNDKLVVTENELVITSDEAGTINLKKGQPKVYVTERSLVITNKKDAYQWWDDYDSPQWTWSKYLWWYVREDPINLAWKDSDIGTIKDEMVVEEGWVDNPSEYTHYVYDPVKGWKKGDGVAESRYRLFGGYHVRLWEMSTGGVVIANAHHDDSVFNWPPGHQADEYEVAEDQVADFYDFDDGWIVDDDAFFLDNIYTNEYGAYNDGKATVITES